MSDLTTHLSEERAAALARLRNGLTRLEAWGTFDNPTRIKTAQALRALLGKAISLAENLRQLPKTTVCVCPRCKQVILPEGEDGTLYQHCGLVWMPQGRGGHQPLPRDFWETHRPGDTYKGLAVADWAKEESA